MKNPHAIRYSDISFREVLDQNQNPLNRQLVEHYREDVLEYTRRQLMGVAVAV